MREGEIEGINNENKGEDKEISKDKRGRGIEGGWKREGGEGKRRQKWKR